MRLRQISCALVAMAALVLSACGGGGDSGSNGSGPGPGPGPGPGGIGAAGGTITGPAGSQVVIPAGALSTNVEIVVAQSGAGAPVLPAGVTAAGEIFAMTPHGTAFASPATVTIPFDPALVPAGASAALYKTNAAQTGWEVVSGATVSGTSLSGQVSSFSFFVAGYTAPPLTRNDPSRQWTFQVYPGNGQDAIVVDEGSSESGDVDEIVAFGPTSRPSADFVRLSESVPADDVANGHAFGTNDGVTYGVFAEAPDGRRGTEEPIGSSTKYSQQQSFIKNAEDAKLTYTLTRVTLVLEDYYPEFEFGQSPLTGSVHFSVNAQRGSEQPFYHRDGRVSLFGGNGHYRHQALALSGSQRAIWNDEDFDLQIQDVSVELPFANCSGTRATLTLLEPLTFSVDLSSLAVGEEFTLYSYLAASTLNLHGGGSQQDCEISYASAFARDPQDIAGTVLEYSGLEPTNQPLPQVPFAPEPVVCAGVTNPDPAAGVLQFESANFIADEHAGTDPVITVTRTGGSAGAVSVNFSTSDGSAIGGTDYIPVQKTVIFDDGDTGTRLVEVPIKADLLGEFDETVELTLSDAGGCAAIGPQGTAVLTIRNDDPLETEGSGLDESFGDAGLASIPIFGGEESDMALQADGKIVMVGGTFTDFVLARFNVDGTLDTGFGDDGKVTTDIAGGVLDERARAVAIQPDGKIVVAGEARQPPPLNNLTVAVARYHPDGSLDTSFGAGGYVYNTIPGRAFDVLVQPDGKIVVAGDAPMENDDTNFQLARLLADGAPDVSFGMTGVVQTNIGALDLARNIVLQPDGKIVASGDAIGASEPTPVARYNPDGTLDPTFGGTGRIVLVNGVGALFGQGLALQADGGLVLVGNTGGGTDARMTILRLLADGTVDTSFANGGMSTTSVTDLGDIARAVAVQADGKILVAGEGNQVNPNFVAVRYLPDGTIDTTFADSGRLEVDFFSARDIAESIAIQPDGRIVIGGSVKPAGADGYGLIRVLP